jgi:hypothetical protein
MPITGIERIHGMFSKKTKKGSSKKGLYPGKAVPGSGEMQKMHAKKKKRTK